MSDSEKEYSGEQFTDLASLVMEQARRVNQKIPVLGPVTWLMMQQGGTRHGLISDLEWRVMPALVLDQAKLYMRDTMPLAFVSWARLSTEAAHRYRQVPHRLAVSDWQSGEQVWIVDLIAPYGGVQDILSDLRKNILAGHVIHQLAPMAQGATKIIKWDAIATSHDQ